MQEIILNPGEQILVKAADVPTIPEPDPSGFVVQTLDNENQWRYFSKKAASLGREHITFGMWSDPVTRRWQRAFRFIDIDTGVSRYIESPEEIQYNPGMQCHLFVSGDRLLIWGSVTSGQGVVAYECTLIYDSINVPIKVVEIRLDNAIDFGTSDSRAMSACLLESGALVGSWYQQTDLPNENIVVGVAYRSPQGIWAHEQFDMLDGHLGGGLTACNGHAVVQHPANNKVWVFFKRDSYHSLSALRFNEIQNGLELDELYPEYLSERKAGWVKENAPEGENPTIEAVPMPDRGTIMMAVQANKYKTFRIEHHPEYGYLTAFVKGAWIVFSEINADGEFLGNQHHLQQWHERLADFGMFYVNNKLWITHHNLHKDVPETWKTPIQIYGSSYDFATDQWSAPIEIALLKGYPMNNLNEPHAEAYDLNALTFYSPDNKTTLVKIE